MTKAALPKVTKESYVDRLYHDFRFFLTELWAAADNGDLAPHHYEMADWISDPDGPRRRGVLAFRGAVKTWIALAWCLWVLFRDAKRRKICIISKSEGHAKDSIELARQWIEQVWFLHHLKPERGQRDSAVGFNVPGAKADRTPSLCAFGIEGQITGVHPTDILADDVETKDNTKTIDARKTLRSQVTEFEAMRVTKLGATIYLGTPHHEESLYAHLMEKAGYVFRAWPCRFCTPAECSAPLGPMFDNPARFNARLGDPVWPDEFGDDKLREDRIAYDAGGPTKFALQMELNWKAAASTKRPLHLGDLIVFAMERDRAPVSIAWGEFNSSGASTVLEGYPSAGFGDDALRGPIFFAPEWAPYTGTKMWVDPAGITPGGDEVAWAIVSHLNGYLFGQRVVGMQGGHGDHVLDAIAADACLYGVNDVLVEKNYGQGTWGVLLEPALRRRFLKPGEDPHRPNGWACSITSVPSSVQKEVMICDALEPLLASHRVVIHPTVAQDLVLQQQLVRITRQRRSLGDYGDDRIESFAKCCKAWIDSMAPDPDRARARQQQRSLEESLRHSLRGLSRSEPRWFKHR